MRRFQSRQFILLLFAFAVAAGSLLVAGSALAEMALFRVERSFHNFPNPAVTTPGGAGKYTAYIQPYATPTAMGGYVYSAATAIVEPGNPVGGAFTLPQSFFGWSGDWYAFSQGYTTIFVWNYYNGPGKFRPHNGATGPTRIVFPTTMGNPYPTYTSTDQKWINGNDGDGNPVAPTTTFDGRYDMSRGGSITVTPGPRRFGGTMRVFHRPNAFRYQYIYYFWPAKYKAYGDYICFDEGKFGCTPNTFVSDIGDTTATLKVTWYLLNVIGSAYATTPTTPNGKAPTPYGNASFITGMRQYLNRIHPWTTGFAKVHNAKGSSVQPDAQHAHHHNRNVQAVSVWCWARRVDGPPEAHSRLQRTRGSGLGSDHQHLPGRPDAGAEGFLRARACGDAAAGRRGRSPAGPVPHAEALIRTGYLIALSKVSRRR